MQTLNGVSSGITYLSSNTNTTPSVNAPNHLAVTANMTQAAWNTAAKHEVFTVTGAVRLRLWAICAGTLTDAADGAVIQFGHEGDTAAFIAATDAAGKNGQTLTAGQLWYDASPDSLPATFATAVLDLVLPNGQDVGYEITGAALTGGSIVFHCVWEPLNSTGNVVAATGGAL